VVCGLLAWFSLRFVRDSREFGDVLLGDLPAWWFQLILPVGFGLIAYRYGVRAATAARTWLVRS
jgi:TRAP-type C4-dicarboxylate transport system permease small subunit